MNDITNRLSSQRVIWASTRQGGMSASKKICLLIAGAFFAQSLLAGELSNGATPPGAAIYQRLCVRCHGPNGQGVDDHKPLYGSRSLSLLARRIERTMPEDEPERCVGEDAKAVADYIYPLFYSPEARARLHRVRRDLVHLTVPQLRTSIADLVGHFMTGPKWISSDERGLKTRYSGRHLTEKEEDGKETKRHSLDMGLTAPALRIDHAGLEALELTPERDVGVAWSGSILPMETGEYEFVLRTRNGVRLWVNERQERNQALIDGWVASSQEVRQERARCFLLGGRPHPLRMRLNISPQEPEGFVELLWRPPHGSLEPVPLRCLSPRVVAPVMVVSTAFPPDDASYGYERGIGVSKAWLEAVNRAAIETADEVSDRLDTLCKPGSDPNDRRAEVKDFLERFAAVAFRRPLSTWQRESLINTHFDDPSLQHATKRVVLQILTSPYFLYPELPDQHTPDDWTVAARLALALWDSLPDQTLREAAQEGNLTQGDELVRQTQRMLQDTRTRTKMRGFFHQWLELDRVDALSKDSEKFPEFNEQVIADLKVSLERFLEGVVWSDRSDYRELLLADYLPLNDRLAKLYADCPVELGSGFQPVADPSGRRAGVLTHPLLLSSLAYHDNTSPIHRGVFLVRNILGMTMKLPPKAIAFKDAEFDPNLTMREKVTQLTRPQACMACHVTINPLGFSLEGFDAIGRPQEADNNRPVDTTGQFVDGKGQIIRITSARDLAQFVATSPDAQKGFVRQLFHHVVKQGAAAYGVDTEDLLYQHFVASDFSVKALLADIAVEVARHDVGAKGDTQRLSAAFDRPLLAKKNKKE